ncbi:MAG: DNA internalization-related competence protein ComEC/Rec2 [Candidatus Eisenbacteria bacterium]
MRRPSLFFLTALWTGLLGGSLVGTHLSLLVIQIVALATALVFACGPRLRLALLAASFFLMGVLRSPESPWNLSPVPPDLASSATVPVVLKVETPFLAADCAERVNAGVREVVVGPLSLLGRQVVLRGLEKVAPPGGSHFTICGRFQPPRDRLNPCGVNPRQQSTRAGVVGAVDVSAIRHERRHGIAACVSSLREKMEGLIRESYPGEAAGMLEAMLLGQRTNLSAHVQTVMIKAGTYHVISVSGLHVGIVLLVISAFLSVFGLPRVPLMAVYAFTIVLYVIFTGTQPSAVRAGAMFLVVSLCRLLQWKTDFPNCVCLAGTILLLVFPHFAWDIGFQLSLGAVLGMTVLVPQISPSRGTGRSWPRKAARYLTTSFIVCLTAQAFTLPIVLYDFGRASLVAPLANLVMVPLTTVAIAGGIEASFAMIFSERLATLLLKASAFMTDVSITATDFLTRLPHALIYTGRPSVLKLLLYSSSVAVLSFGTPRMGRSVKLLILVGLHAFLIIPLGRGSGDLLRVIFLYVGSGDAAFVEMPGGENMLIDVGPNTEIYGQAQNKVLSFLAMRGVNRLDKVTVSHAHDDHYGGLVSLLESMAVGEILVGGLGGEPDYQRLLERAQGKGIGVRTVKAGDSWQTGGVVMEVLYPREVGAGSPTEDANGQSVVMRITYGRIGLLFTGDATPEVQREILAGSDSLGSRRLRSRVLKVPHHGAPNSLDGSFVRALGAGIAVISVGSKFASHPSPATIALLEASGLKTLRTSVDGAVTLVTDGRSLELKTECGTEILETASGISD